MILYGGGVSNPAIYFLEPYEHELHDYEERSAKSRGEEPKFTKRARRTCNVCHHSIEADEPMICIDNGCGGPHRRTTSICVLCWGARPVKVSKKTKEMVRARHVLEEL